MSDHPEIPRVEFHGDGHSMNVEEAVERFRAMLTDYAEQMTASGFPNWGFALEVELRPCDCEETLEGFDDACPLHGDPDGEALYPLPEWCSTNSCEDERCHRCFPRKGCTKHEKCRHA